MTNHQPSSRQSDRISIFVLFLETNHVKEYCCVTVTVESRLEIALRLLLEQCARFTRGEPSSKLVCGIGLSREPPKPQQAWSMFASCHQYRVLPPSDDTRCRRADTDVPRSLAARSSSGDGSQASVGAAVGYCRVVWARVAFWWWAGRCDGSDFFLRSMKSTARASRKKKNRQSRRVEKIVFRQ